MEINNEDFYKKNYYYDYWISLKISYNKNIYFIEGFPEEHEDCPSTKEDNNKLDEKQDIDQLKIINGGGKWFILKENKFQKYKFISNEKKKLRKNPIFPLNKDLDLDFNFFQIHEKKLIYFLKTTIKASQHTLPTLAKIHVDKNHTKNKTDQVI